MNQNRDIEFLFEIGQLRLIKRMWLRFFQSDIASISDHIFRVLWIALAIAKREGNVNEEKIMKMALLHDIPESRTGDVDYIARQYVKRDEDTAVQDMLANTSLEGDFLSLWKEYCARECMEAKIVKDADMLDVDLELQEQSIQTISKKWMQERKKAVRSRLYTKTAQEYFDRIYASEADDWHLKGRNRFNAGDWKEGEQQEK